MKTIRSRLIIIFTVCFTFAGGLTVLYYYNIFASEKKLLMIEQFEDFKEQVLELRRFEKNYFLTRDAVHLKQIDEYLSKVENSFNTLENEMKTIVDPADCEHFAVSLIAYRDILEDSRHVLNKKELSIENLQEHGRILTTFSEKLISEKRKRLKHVLDQMVGVPFLMSIGLVVLVFLVTRVIREDVLKPLSLIHKFADKASQGIFTPIPYGDGKKNEASQCIRAFNKMVVEIDSGHEQLLHSRKMASIGTFTSGIAHELNNPINNISLIVETLISDQDTLSPEDRMELYNDLMSQTERSSEIVRDLLEFSRTDQGQISTISMEDMVEKTERLLANEMKYQGINFHVEIQDDLPKLRIDQSRLQQALVNLLINGIQAMPDGGDLRLRIETDKETGYVRIDVEDTGIGIPRDQIDKIFDPFFTTKKEGEGTGLGLSVTYNIITQHSGEIRVKSKKNKGTCFSIFLPVKN